MSTKLWPAEPHTVAKIEILRGYLGAWCAIFAQSPRSAGQSLVYVDGFAGPGRYSNGYDGSPVIAIKTFLGLRDQLKPNGQWKLGKLRCIFIEQDRSASDHLENILSAICPADDDIEWSVTRGSFAEAFPGLGLSPTSSFGHGNPTLLFLDPFGATGVPFSVIRDVLSQPRCEILLNLDHDGYARIIRAGESSNANRLLSLGLGDPSLQNQLVPLSFPSQCERITEMYKDQLRSIPGVDYVYSFRMKTSRMTESYLGYSLVFASRNPKGLERMKESMKRLAQNGDFSFSNAFRGQMTLFRTDDPADHAQNLYSVFAGCRTTLDALNKYALIHTPFTNAKKMLEHLDRENVLEVVSTNPKRRRGTFADSATKSTQFKERRS